VKGAWWVDSKELNSEQREIISLPIDDSHLRRVSTTLRQSAKEFSEYSFLENPMRRVC
jgi:hypothetical protein